MFYLKVSLQTFLGINGKEQAYNFPNNPVFYSSEAAATIPQLPKALWGGQL